MPHVHHMSTCRLLMHATFGSRLKVVTFTVLVRLVKSKRSASDLVPYHISAQLILLTYYSRYIGGTAVDTNYPECSQNLRVQKSGKSLADVLMVLQELRITCLSALKRGKKAARRRHYQTAALPCQLPTTQHQQTPHFLGMR